jgi:hypothetical protein
VPADGAAGRFERHRGGGREAVASTAIAVVTHRFIGLRAVDPENDEPTLDGRRLVDREAEAATTSEAVRSSLAASVLRGEPARSRPSSLNPALAGVTTSRPSTATR